MYDSLDSIPVLRGKKGNIHKRWDLERELRNILSIWIINKELKLMETEEPSVMPRDRVESCGTLT